MTAPMGTLYYLAWCEQCHSASKVDDHERFAAQSEQEDWARQHVGTNPGHRVDLWMECADTP